MPAIPPWGYAGPLEVQGLIRHVSWVLLLGVACRPNALAPVLEDSGNVSAGQPPEVVPSTPTDSAEQVGPAPDPTDEVFDLNVVHTINLEMDESAWSDIRNNPSAETWYVANFRWDDELVSNVGVRSFGAGSQTPGKPPLKISFDREVEGQDWRTLEQLKLDCSSQDAGFLNEPIGTSVVRAMGQPAARTGWARVGVNGEDVGFFVVLEPVDDVFLERHFGNDDGPLYGTYDWRYGQGLNPITWGGPLDWYVPQTSVGTDGSDILAAIEAVSSGDDDTFRSLVDVEGILRTSAARAAMGAIDAFTADGNNFYLFDDHGQMRMIPWDFDADLGYPGYFSNALEMGMEQPWLWSHARNNPVTGAVYSDPVYARGLTLGFDLAGYVQEMLAGPLDWETIDGVVVEAADVIREEACSDTYHSCESHLHRVADLRFFLHSRLSRLAGGEVADCPEETPWTVTTLIGSPMVDETSWGPGFVVNGEHHCTGVYAGAPSDLVITVEAGVLTGAVGIHDWNGTCGDGVAFSVSQGEDVLWRSGILSGYEPAEELSVNVASGELHLETDPLGSAACDHAVWVDLAVARN